MKQKQHSTEEIIRILRQAEEDSTVEDGCREHNISKATFHRWKRKYGDMDLADAKRLKELKNQNGELKKMLAESILKIRVLEEFNAKKWQARRRKSRPLSTWSTKGCAQCVGPVAIWACIGRPTAIAPNHRCLNRSNSTSVLSRFLGNIPAMAIAASGRYWRGKAGRSAASKSSASGGKRA